MWSFFVFLHLSHGNSGCGAGFDAELGKNVFEMLANGQWADAENRGGTYPIFLCLRSDYYSGNLTSSTQAAFA